MSRWSQQDIQALLAQSRLVVQEARAAMEAQQRMLEELDFDPRASLEELRKLGGDEAVAQVQAQVEEAVRQFEEEVERNLKGAPKAAVAGRRQRGPRNMV